MSEIIINKVTRHSGKRRLADHYSSIDIELDGKWFRLTNEHGALKVHALGFDGKITVKPCCANEVLILNTGSGD